MVTEFVQKKTSSATYLSPPNGWQNLHLFVLVADGCQLSIGSICVHFSLVWTLTSVVAVMHSYVMIFRFKLYYFKKITA